MLAIGTALALCQRMKISELMTRNVETCRTVDTLAHAAQLMWEHDLGALPAIDEHGRVAGMITDRDICMAAYTRGEPLSAMAVSSAMSAHPTTCLQSDDVPIVEAAMAQRQLHRLPVVDDDDRLVGIISLNDLARAMAESTDISPYDVASTLAAVSAARSGV